MTDDDRICPTCGGALPPDAPRGACPRCLLAAGFESGDGGPPAPDEDLARVAEQFPELELLEVVGRGGMGVVYKARQRDLDRIVALKVLPRAVADAAPDAARFEERFMREARALARLSHPHIVAVHEFGEKGGAFFYFLMEYVDGTNLRQAMAAGRLSPKEALAIVPQICDALQYAHDQGVVHRDIKPENVLLARDGTVKIVDFGLAKLVTRAAGDRTLTQQGLVMGTPHYMAPEQLEKPSEVDHRADIYSLGVVLYEMLTGELPIGRFAPPSEKVHVDVRLDHVVLRSLEKERERRYQAVSEVSTELDAVPLESAADSGHAPHAGRRGGRYSRLAFWGLMLPLCVAALAVLGAGVLYPAATAANGTMRGVGVPLMLIAAFVGVAVLAGVVLSIAGLVQIRRSGGRLHGTGLAIAGLVMPLLCCLPGLAVPAMWITRVEDAQHGSPGPEPLVRDMVVPPIAATYEGRPVTDLGDVRIEVTLGAGEAAAAPARMPLTGLGGLRVNAHMNTRASATWPPEPGTLLHVRGLQRRTSATSSEASLLLDGRRIGTVGREAGAESELDVFVSAARIGELVLELSGPERQVVVVYGRVVSPEER